MKVSDIIKEQKIVELQEKVDILYGRKLYDVIPKLYKFNFPKEKTDVMCLLDDSSTFKAQFQDGKLLSSIRDIEVDNEGAFKLEINDSVGYTTFLRKFSGKVLYEIKIMYDPKFLKKLLRNYYKFM